MDINSRLEFAADPATVHQMMTSRDWLEQLVATADASSHTIDIAGNTTRIDMALNAPAAASKVVGATMNLRQTVQWAEPNPDGSRDGTLTIEVPGMPVTMDGRAHLVPGGRGTVVDYTGQLKVNIPIMGRAIEKQAAPFITDAINAQQQVGDQWLAGRA